MQQPRCHPWRGGGAARRKISPSQTWAAWQRLPIFGNPKETRRTEALGVKTDFFGEMGDDVNGLVYAALRASARNEHHT
jgi:hypothetical protein